MRKSIQDHKIIWIVVLGADLNLSNPILQRDRPRCREQQIENAGQQSRVCIGQRVKKKNESSPLSPSSRRDATSGLSTISDRPLVLLQASLPELSLVSTLPHHLQPNVATSCHKTQGSDLKI